VTNCHRLKLPAATVKDCADTARTSALPNPVAEAIKLRGHARDVIALDLDLAISRRPARPARIGSGLQCRRKG